MADSFSFELISPEQILLSEDITAATLPASEGEMTVMKNHALTVATISPGLIRVTTHEDVQKTIFVDAGFADIRSNGLCVLAERAIPAEELTTDTLSHLLKEAEEKCTEAEGNNKDIAELRISHLKQVKQDLAL